jgi:ACS family tartrate transporter-like MFS transporter
MSDPDGTGEVQERFVLARVSLRLLPFLFLLYVVNILDRVNVSFAKLHMLPDLGLTGDQGEAVYGLGASIFYIGYLIFEVPSNFILHRVGARIWIGRIMVSWGLISTAMLFVQGPMSFYFLRFLLGVAEAGFFPGIILYLSYWFPAQQRARAVALFMMAAPVAGIFGNPLSGAILEYLKSAGGLAGWQWLFLLEGLPSVVLGIVVWFYLDDAPEKARWLASDEQTWLTARLQHEAKQREEHHGLTRLSALARPRVWHLIALYFTPAVGSNVFGFYAPTLIKETFPDRREFTIGLLVALPSVAAMVSMVLVGIHSDRTGNRRLHVALSAFITAAGWALAAATSDPTLIMLGLVLAQAGVMCMLPTFWATATSYLGGPAAVGGIALINSVGNLGGFLGPKGFSALKVATGTFTAGMNVMALTLAVGGLLALALRRDRALRPAP